MQNKIKKKIFLLQIVFQIVSFDYTLAIHSFHIFDKHSFDKKIWDIIMYENDFDSLVSVVTTTLIFVQCKRIKLLILSILSSQSTDSADSAETHTPEAESKRQSVFVSASSACTDEKSEKSVGKRVWVSVRKATNECKECQAKERMKRCKENEDNDENDI